MLSWGNWNFSVENELFVTDFCSRLKSESISRDVSAWWCLYCDEKVPSQGKLIEKAVEKAEQTDTELTGMELNIVHLIHDALETNSNFEEGSFTGVSFSSLFKIFYTINQELNDMKLLAFCEIIGSWKNDFLIEQSMKAIILPRLQDRNESTACTIYSMVELAKQKPVQFCHNVLHVLLVEETSKFSDSELLSKIYYNLPEPQRDFIILSFTSKDNAKENDWMLLEALVKCLSLSSVNNLIEFIHKWSKKFSKSLSYGRFLVNFCKNINFFENKDMLVEAIETHDTLFKRQAIRILEQVWK